MKLQRFIALLLGTVVLTFAGGLAPPVHVFAHIWQLPEGALIKASGPEVDQIQNGQRRWIPDSATFVCMGLNWTMVQSVSDSDWKQIPAGKAYPSRADGTLLRGSDATVYVMNGCQRHGIPDQATFTALGYKTDAVQQVADADLQAIPLGAQVPATQSALTATRSDQVGSGLFMQTRVNVVPSSGLVNAVTQTWTTTSPWRSFTGGVQVWLLDKNGVILAITPMRTFFARGSRWDQWVEQVDPKIASQAASVQIVQLYAPVNRPVTDPHFVGSSAKTVKGVLCTAYPALAICQG